MNKVTLRFNRSVEYCGKIYRKNTVAELDEDCLRNHIISALVFNGEILVIRNMQQASIDTDKIAKNAKNLGLSDKQVAALFEDAAISAPSKDAAISAPSKDAAISAPSKDAAITAPSEDIAQKTDIAPAEDIAPIEKQDIAEVVPNEEVAKEMSSSEEVAKKLPIYKENGKLKAYKDKPADGYAYKKGDFGFWVPVLDENGYMVQE